MNQCVRGNKLTCVCLPRDWFKFNIRWVVDLPGGSSNDLTVEVSFSQTGRVPPPTINPFGFEFYASPLSSASSVISELRVTAVRELMVPQWNV